MSERKISALPCSPKNIHQCAQLAASVPVGIFRSDAAGNGIYHNQLWHEITGISLEAALGRGWEQCLHPDDRDLVVAEFQKSVEQGQAFQLEYRLRRPDGQTIWVYGQAMAERDAAGVVIGFTGSITNIHKRKKIEAQLELQNAVLAKIAKSEPLTDILHAVIAALEQSMESAICSVMLLGQDDRLWTGAAPNLPADYNQAIDGILIGEGSCGQAVLRNEMIVVENIATDPIVHDYREIAAQYGLCSCWSLPIRASDGRAIGTLGVYYHSVRSPQPDELDLMTRMSNLAGIAIEKEQARIALSESQARWQFALEGAGDGLWDWHIATNQIFFSGQWKAMLGYADHEIGNHPEEWEQRIHPDDKAQCLAELDRCFRGEVPFYQVEHRLRCKDDSYKWILARGKVIERTAAGESSRIIGTHTDIHERKQAERQLQNLIAGTAATTGAEFFPALVSHIAASLAVSYVLVTEKVDEKLRTLAFAFNSVLQPGFTYPIANTPCERSLSEGVLFCPSLVQQAFPADLDLVSMEAESYLGIALYSSQGQAIGNLCILDQQPIKDPQRAEDLLRVFGGRASAELERARAIQDLAKLNQELEGRIAERTAALQKSEQRYRLLMDGASDAIIMCNSQGNVIEGNRRAEELLGYNRAELIGLHMSQLHPPAALAAARHHFKNVVGNQTPPVLESIVLCKDGRQVAVDITGSRIEIDGESIAQGILRDITERKQAELALAEEALRRATIFNASSDGIHVVDQQGNLLEANYSFAQMLGYTMAEIYALKLFDWDAQWSPAELLAILQDNDLDDSVFETIHRRKDGSVFPVEISRRHMEWQGKVILVNISRDITDRKENEQRLARSNAELLRATRLKDEFLANMSHELRTPLNAILGFSETLLEEVLGAINDRQRKAITTIESSGEHLLSLINDILEVSKIEAGQLELDITTVSVANLCNSSLAFVNQQALKKQIQIVTTLDHHCDQLEVDERRLRQVLINLLNNAVKFTPEGGRVSLEVMTEYIAGQSWIHFAVIDTGIGIDRKDQPKLFKPFVQIDAKLNRQYEGTGLGLALAKQIVELHGGSISLISSLGRGSCFVIRLPYDAIPEVLPSSPLR